MNNFLYSVLPDTGIYQVASTHGSRFTHYPCSSIAEMTRVIKKIDAKKQNVYFACASYYQKSYKDSAGKVHYRTNENAGWAKSFWIDIDCGADKALSGKGYATTDEASQAVNSFCEGLSLPSPMIIASGGGLHLYWPLKETITKDQWKITANKLKVLTQKHRLLADDTRTADIASVLRPVSSHNWKPSRGGREVTLHKEANPTPFAQFDLLISKAYNNCLIQKNVFKKAIPKEFKSDFLETPSNITRVKSALASIDPNCDRSIWRDICFALHSLEWKCSKDLAQKWSMGELL